MFTRRQILAAGTAATALAALPALRPAWASTGSPGTAARRFDLDIGRSEFTAAGRRARALTINGTLPGPLLRMREGDEVLIRVRNRLEVDTSLHWHGILLPAEMDGVPGLSFAGIRPGETFEYRFRLRQHGTYWYHSHSGFQEQAGVYAPLVVDPAGTDAVAADREFVIVLSDWTTQNPERVFSNLKKNSEYYNRQRRTVADFFRDAHREGLGAAWRDRLAWGEMRMDPTDIADVTAYTYTHLLNGHAPDERWTGRFAPGERVRLRFINASAMSYYNVRIPGVPLTVVQADGQDVVPFEIDEFQLAVAETLDVVVTPPADRAVAIFAESMDRSGHALGELSPAAELRAEVPDRRRRPLRTMGDMGHGGHGGHAMHAGASVTGPAGPAADAHAAMGHGGTAADAHAAMGHGATPTAAHAGHTGHGAADPAPAPAASTRHDPAAHGGAGAGAAPAGHGGHAGHAAPAATHAGHGPDPTDAVPDAVRSALASEPPWRPSRGPSVVNVVEAPSSRLDEAGTGLGGVPHRVLSYAALAAREPFHDRRAPGREIFLHLTGNMRRYMWSLEDGAESSPDAPIRLALGERVRLTFINHTMMEHPVHLHGMWMELVNGQSPMPRKHTISVKPAERLSVDVTADAPGDWAFHCHLLMHMKAGMMRTVRVEATAGPGSAGSHRHG